MPEDANSAVWQVGDREVRVTHLSKLYWPSTSVTKGDALRYYLAIASTILPYLRDRPVTMRMFPEGAAGPSFYRREAPEDAPAWIRRAAYHPKTAVTSARVSALTIIDDSASLIWLANAGSLEFHPWSARLPDLEHPDQAIFDLDPGEGATFEDVCQAALLLRSELAREGLQSAVKTSGGRGIHVYVPLAPEQPFEQIRVWVKSIAERLAAAHPTLVAVAHGATHRGKQVTIDHAQNSIGRNTAAPYTLRARLSHPVVSTPLTWKELEAGEIDSDTFTPDVVLDRVRRLGDLFVLVTQGGQNLPRHERDNSRRQARQRR
jgi:bifunctional non-homologous end joining protein LigD